MNPDAAGARRQTARADKREREKQACISKQGRKRQQQQISRSTQESVGKKESKEERGSECAANRSSQLASHSPSFSVLREHTQAAGEG